MEELANYPDVLAAAQAYLSRTSHLVDLIVQVQQIPAPTDAEEQRAHWVQERFRALGLRDVSMDAQRNIYGRIVGRADDGTAASKPALMVSAHTDTVFPLHIDLTVRHEPASNRVYGPGIGDNSTGVASLLALAEALGQLPAPPVDIWLVANSGEEGLGDLRGMRAAVDLLQEQIGACIVVEGMGLGRIVHRALGSRRYRIRVKAPGGHSWSDFGTASAIHTLLLLGADLARLRVATSPRTTYNVGRISGGTSINTIAQEASLELDMRSEDSAALNQLVSYVDAIVDRYRSSRWQKWGVQVDVEVIGDRPSGDIPADHAMVQAAVRALAGAGLTSPPDLRISSTDANIPLSRGIPAVCVGVTEGGNAHRLEEWISTAPLAQGMQHLLMLTWWSALWLGGEAG